MSMCANPGCPKPIPDTARKDARFCCPSCRVSAARKLKAFVEVVKKIDGPPSQPGDEPGHVETSTENGHTTIVQKHIFSRPGNHHAKGLVNCRIERTKQGKREVFKVQVAGISGSGTGSTLPAAYRDALSKVKMGTPPPDLAKPQPRATKKK